GGAGRRGGAGAGPPGGGLGGGGGGRRPGRARSGLAGRAGGAPPEPGGTMRAAGPAAAADPGLGLLQLVAVKGDSVGARFETSGAAQPVTIGRKPTNDFVLRDVTVSREHAVIEPTPDGWRIMARKNSARLLRAGEQVPEDGVLLVDGDEIHLGLAVVKVTIVPAAEDGEDDRTVVFVAGDVPAPSVVAPKPAPPVKDEIRSPPRARPPSGAVRRVPKHRASASGASTCSPRSTSPPPVASIVRPMHRAAVP